MLINNDQRINKNINLKISRKYRTKRKNRVKYSRFHFKFHFKFQIIRFDCPLEKEGRRKIMPIIFNVREIQYFCTKEIR